jgi:preprotein translocase subunit SecG
MEAFVTVLHILVAFLLIALVLLQDSKSGVGGAFGGGGSSSVFGATGAATLAQRFTRYAAVVFAVTSILLSIFTGRLNKSVMDSAPSAAQSIPAPTIPAATNETPAAAAQAPAAQSTPAPAAPTK